MATNEGTLKEFLEKNNLGKYYEKFYEQGAREIEDLRVGVDRQLLIEDIGMKTLEANKLLHLINEMDQISNPVSHDIIEIITLQKARTEMEIKYKFFTDFDPIIQTIHPIDTTIMYYYDLVNQICKRERIGENVTVDLYTSEGYPLACSPSSYVLKLFEWHLEAYSDIPLLYAIPRLRVYTDRQVQDSKQNKLPRGDETIFVQNIDSPIQTNCTVATFDQLLYRIQSITGIPTHLISLFKDGDRVFTSKNEKLDSLNIKNKTGLELKVNEEFWEPILFNNFSFKQYHPTWHTEQSLYGISVFFSCLYTLVSSEDEKSISLKTLGHIRSLTGCPPLIHALNLLISDKNITLAHIVAITEMLVKLFKVSKPKILKGNDFVGEIVKDSEVTEHTRLFWAYLISRANQTHEASEQYETLTLFCSGSGKRMTNPVMVRDPENREHIVDRENYRGKENRLTYLPNYKRITTSFPMFSLEAIVWKGELKTSCCVDLTREWESLKEESATVPLLSIQVPLSVKTCTPPCMTPIHQNIIGVYTGYAKDGSQKYNYFNPILGEEQILCVEELDKDIKMSQKTSGKKEGMETLTRVPEEIIMVLLDTSDSMKEKYLEHKTKRDSVNEAFIAFSDRSSAYDMKHGVGLILFTQNSTLKYPISENFRDFSSQFSSFPTGGSTAVYDGILFAVKRLNDFYVKYPKYNQVPRRILCLTDGHDNSSKIKSEDAASLLIQNNIIMDAVLLTPYVVDTHSIAKASGGYSFQPKSSEELLNIFENEPMLTMKMRKHIHPQFTPNCKVTFKNVQFDFDVIPEHKRPETKLEQPVITAYKLLSHMRMQRVLNNNSSNPNHIKRILQELAFFAANPHKNFEIFPCENGIDFWQLLLRGPEGTKYENRFFRLYIEFGDKYPKECPNVRFITPIYHCNINQAGKVCHAILDRYYNSDVRIKHILDYICGLLMDPTPDDPLDSVKANQLRFNPELYNKMAREHAERYAIDIRLKTDTRMKILGRKNTSEINVPGEELICPLTHELFIDPVSNKEGDSYEREAIVEHIRSGNEYDPFSKLPLKEEDLRPNLGLKKMADQFRAELETASKS